MKQKLQRCWHTTHKSYLLLCIALSGLSIVTLVSVGLYGGLHYSGTFGNMRLAVTQVLATGLGLLGAIVLSMMDYRKLVNLWPLHMAICWGLVLLTFVPGIGYDPGTTGSHSWIAMPFGMSFQPTELAKISFYLSFAHHLAKVHTTLSRPKTLLPVLLHILVPVLLVHLQGDDGTATVFLAIGVVMLFMAGINRWVVISCMAAALASLPLMWNFVLTTHQKERIWGLFYPDLYVDTTMHQQLQARIAIGAGRLTGTGLFNPQHYYVPRSENDFIFSYFAESCGFIGCLVFFALLFALMWKTLQTAQNAASRTGAYLCIGVFATLLFQSTVNIGMNLLLLPVMGLTLPFMSAGGTSVLTLYLSVGLVLSVERGSRRLHKIL